MPSDRARPDRPHFAANLGFLWTDLPFLERIGRAKAAGFDALEFHDQAQGVELGALKAELSRAGLPVTSMNTAMGETGGRAALAEMKLQARTDIDDAARTGEAIGADAIHLLAGTVQGAEARQVFLDNISHALDAFAGTVLIEPVSQAARSGYHLSRLDDAAAILVEIDHPRLRIMFDCFHVMHEHGDLPGMIRRYGPLIGNVQIASFPDRAEPHAGTLDYARLIPLFRQAGYRGSFGCEYTAKGAVEDGLGWRDEVFNALG